MKEPGVQELYGLGDRYLLRVEHRSGQGAEFPLAVWVQAFVYPDPGLLVEPVLPDAGGSAVRAGSGDDGVDEGDLGLAPLPVLFVEPFGYGLFGEGSQLPRFRRKRRFGGPGLLFVHVWRFRQKRGRRPKPPSLEKAPARLRALDADSFGSAPSLYIEGTVRPSRANKSLHINYINRCH